MSAVSRYATTDSDMTVAEARAITDMIREHTSTVWNMLIEAHERKAWQALGYETWAAYVKREFNISRGRSYQLIDQARTIHAIESVVSTTVDISEREARDIKADLPEVIADIENRLVSTDVDNDDEKRAVVAEVIDLHRQNRVQVNGVTADARTGEVLDEPTVTTHTETFKTETKTVPVEPQSLGPKPAPTGDEANRLNAIQTSKSIGHSLEALQYLNYEHARHGIVTEWWPIGKHDVPPEQAAYFTPAELRKLAQGLTETADLLEAHHVN